MAPLPSLLKSAYEARQDAIKVQKDIEQSYTIGISRAI